MRGRGRYRPAWPALPLLAAAAVTGCAADHPRPRAVAACIRLWNRQPGHHREALAIAEHGALPDRGVYITMNAPRGGRGELGASRGVTIGPGRCVLGEQRNVMFVYARGRWHLLTPTDSSDPALAVVYSADDHPNAHADGEGFLAPGR
jgi:hypothetical protein